MDLQRTSVSPITQAVSQAQAAFKSGQLNAYKPLQYMKTDGPQVVRMASWGPMMKK